VITTALCIKAVVLPLVCALLWVGRDLLNGYIGVPVAVPLIVGLVILEFGNLFIRIIAGDLAIGDTAVLRLSRNVVWLVGGLALTLNGFRSLGLIYAYVAGVGVMTVWAFLRCDVTVTRPSVSMAKSLARYAKYDVVAGASRRIHNWGDVLVIGYFLTPSAVAIYEIAWRITQLTSLVSVGMSNVIFPDTSDAATQDDHERIQSNLRTAVLWSCVLVVPALFGGVLLAESILDVVFGVISPDGAVVLAVLLLGQTLFVNYSPFKRVLDGLGHVRLSARSTIGMAVSNIGLNVVFVYYFGIVGAAAATSISMVIGLGLVSYYLRQHLRFEYPLKEAVFFLASAMVMAAAVGGVSRLIDTSTKLGLTVTISLGAAVYLGMLLGFENTRTFIFQEYRKVQATSGVN
jgi:O-antigen/teichoic acid export membrane protein